MIDHDHVCPLVGGTFVHLDIRRANFSAVEQIVICEQYYFKNAKLMSVLKFLKMQFLIKQVNFRKM